MPPAALRRRTLGLLALPGLAHAQAAPPPARIGFLDGGSKAANGRNHEALAEALRGFGYVEGRNLTLTDRWAEADPARAAREAAAVVAERPDLIVTGSSLATRAVLAATRSIPVVMVAVGDAVGDGFAASLARPGGNATGMSAYFLELVGKQADLLREMLPGLARLALLWNPGSPATVRAAAAMRGRLDGLGVAAVPLPVADLAAIEQALAPGARIEAEALLILSDPLTISQSRRIAALVGPHRLPALHTVRAFAEAGGLAAYGPSLPDQFRQVAPTIAKILAGAKPGEIPILLPTRFELVLNAKAAREIGVALPLSLLAGADEVIE
jgi:putative ABC transport system substrate-binding protein